MKFERVLQEFDLKLIPLGFKKKGSTWYKKYHSVTTGVNLSKSTFGNIFTISAGVFIPSIEREKNDSIPKNYSHCHLDGIVSSFIKDIDLRNKFIREYCSFENVTEELMRKRIIAIAEVLSHFDILSILESLSTFEGIKKYMIVYNNNSPLKTRNVTPDGLLNFVSMQMNR